MLEKEIENTVGQYHDPYLEKTLAAAKAIKRVTVNQSQVEIEIAFGYPIQGLKAQMEADLKALIAPLTANKVVNIQLSSHIEAHAGKQGIPGLPGIKNIIAVASGKGGVGKSTIAINLALALAAEGAQVGLLDADIYGPSQPTMLGGKVERPALEEGKLLPLQRHGIQAMSIGYLIDENAAMVWRGPMIGKAMQQLLHDTRWESLDYLIIDLPPGTGDIQLTLCQKIPVSGAVIVTTPQDLALLDVRRACEMFNKLNVPLLGIVENMSHYHCPQCGHEEAIFGAGGAEKLAREYSLSVLQSIPLDIHIREMTDHGYPPVLQAPDTDYAKAFYELARKTAAKLSLQTKDFSARFPKIVVEHNKGQG